MSEAHIRQDLLRFSRLCYERNLLVALDGNLSALLPDGNILCTKAGCHKGMLTDADLVVIDRKGQKIRGEGDPTSEMAMHLACYDTRPDVRAEVHQVPRRVFRLRYRGRYCPRSGSRVGHRGNARPF